VACGSQFVQPVVQFVVPIAPLNVPVVKKAFIPVKLAPVSAGEPVLGRKFGLVE
jgi:hypothetical protein